MTLNKKGIATQFCNYTLIKHLQIPSNCRVNLRRLDANRG